MNRGQTNVFQVFYGTGNIKTNHHFEESHLCEFLCRYVRFYFIATDGHYCVIEEKNELH